MYAKSTTQYQGSLKKITALFINDFDLNPKTYQVWEFSTILRSLGGPIRGDIRPAVGGQRSPGRRLPGKTPRTRSGSEESAEHQRDGYQASTQAQTPQHHHFQVSPSDRLVHLFYGGYSSERAYTWCLWWIYWRSQIVYCSLCQFCWPVIFVSGLWLHSHLWCHKWHW